MKSHYNAQWETWGVQMDINSSPHGQDIFSISYLEISHVRLVSYCGLNWVEVESTDSKLSFLFVWRPLELIFWVGPFIKLTLSRFHSRQLDWAGKNWTTIISSLPGFLFRISFMSTFDCWHLGFFSFTQALDCFETKQTPTSAFQK